jgi:hypothetical protein
MTTSLKFACKDTPNSRHHKIIRQKLFHTARFFLYNKLVMWAKNLPPTLKPSNPDFEGFKLPLSCLVTLPFLTLLSSACFFILDN